MCYIFGTFFPLTHAVGGLSIPDSHKTKPLATSLGRAAQSSAWSVGFLPAFVQSRRTRGAAGARREGDVPMIRAKKQMRDAWVEVLLTDFSAFVLYGEVIAKNPYAS